MLAWTASSSPCKRARVSPARERTAESVADLGQQRVTRGVPEAVVHVLEVVEIAEQHTQRSTVALVVQGPKADDLAGPAAQRYSQRRSLTPAGELRELRRLGQSELHVGHPRGLTGPHDPAADGEVEAVPTSSVSPVTAAIR